MNNTVADQLVADVYEQHLVLEVSKQLRYEVNATVNLVWNGKHHPTYAPQAMIRQQGYELRGAISLAVRLAGSVHRSLPDELLESANRAAQQAITFKKN